LAYFLSALYTVLHGIGLRRSEVVSLDANDYHAETGALAVRCSKGNKAHIGCASRGARAPLDKWLFLHGNGGGPLLMPALIFGRIIHRRMTDQAVSSVLLKRAKQTGAKHLSSHDLRRTFISDLSDTGRIVPPCKRWAAMPT
jgi:site-specific recombinase XerD